MKRWKVWITIDAQKKEYTNETPTKLKTFIVKSLRDSMAAGLDPDGSDICIGYIPLSTVRTRRKMTDAEKLARRIARDQAKLAELQP